MSKTEQLEEVKFLLKWFQDLELEDLLSRPNWGEINFEESRGDLTRVFSITGHLNILPLELETDVTVNQIKEALVSVKTIFEKLDSFSISVGSPKQSKDQLVAELHRYADVLYTQATPSIPYLAYQKGDVAKNIQDLTAAVSTASGLLESAQNDIRSKSGEIDTIVTAAREASAGAGAAVFTEDFKNEASSLQDAAFSWLVVTGILAVGTLVFAMYSWSLTSLPTSTIVETSTNGWLLAQQFSSRLVVLAVLFTATFWCGRNYKALMHQASNNRHRALSLQTFQAFSAAASDATIKDAVLMETTRSIFSNTSTGYIDSVPSQDSPVRVVEVAKVVNPES